MTTTAGPVPPEWARPISALIRRSNPRRLGTPVAASNSPRDTLWPSTMIRIPIAAVVAEVNRPAHHGTADAMPSAVMQQAIATVRYTAAVGQATKKAAQDTNTYSVATATAATPSDTETASVICSVATMTTQWNCHSVTRGPRRSTTMPATSAMTALT